MNSVSIVHRHNIRVRYADTDKMQVVYNGKYFEYFEVGRTELLRNLGLTYAEMEREGTRLPVIECFCKYLAPAVYDDVLVVETRMDAEPGARMRLDYRILNGASQQLLAEGYTVHAFQDTQTLRPTRPPARFLEALAQGAQTPDPVSH